MKRLLAVFLIAAGCAPTIQSASPDHVTIGYEPGTSQASVNNRAAQACAEFGKERAVRVADLQANPALPAALARQMATFRCE